MLIDQNDINKYYFRFLNQHLNSSSKWKAIAIQPKLHHENGKNVNWLKPKQMFCETKTFILKCTQQLTSINLLSGSSIDTFSPEIDIFVSSNEYLFRSAAVIFS